MTYCLMKVEMEDESDIYSDLPLYNFDVELEKLKSSNKNLCVEIANLQEELQKVTKEKDEYQTRCATLTKNISSLLKTAQAEIQRKDKLIKELRDQIAEINLETRGYRKRKIQKDSVPAEAPATKRSANGIIEDSNRRKDGFSSAYRENSSTVNEKKTVSSSNDRSKQDASAVNTEIGLLRPTTQRLPFANVQCKTLYSQRMLDKMQAPSTTNQSTDVQPKSISDKETNDNEKIAQRNGIYESAGVKETAIDKVKGNEDEKFVDNCMKSDAANASPFLVPEVNGIMKISADKRQSEANPEPKRGEQIEALFGSPLKWTENSNETVPQQQVASTSTTVYEDSCSAHIENAKFTLDFNKPSLPKPLSVHKDSVQKIAPVNKPMCTVQRQELTVNVSDKEKSTSHENKWLRAFENVSNKTVNKPKTVFSPLRKDPSKFSSISVNINKECSVDIPHNFLLKSKYEDSVLGQFDDTTQFVSALTKVESQISPLNTPVKCSSQPISVNISTSSVLKSNTLKESEQLRKPSNSSSQIANTDCRPVSKTINEKPINILQPRKTPRIVSYNKTNDINGRKTCQTIAETPTKSNRFAINEEFISKQEEKVLKNSFSNVKDPIAISISSKHKTKDSHSPKAKGLRLSPKGKQKNLGVVSKVKKTKLILEKKLNFTNKSDERIIKDSEKINNNLQNKTSTEQIQACNNRSKEIFESSLTKSRLSLQENPSNLPGNSEKLNKHYWSTKENCEKDQSRLHQSNASENSGNIRRSREKQAQTQSKHENTSNTTQKCQEKLMPKLSQNVEDNLRKSSEIYHSTSQQSNQKNSFNSSRSGEKNLPQSSSLERLNLQKIHEEFHENGLKNSGRSHEIWQQQNRSQEITTKEHQTSDGTSSRYHQNSREKQSKRKIIDNQSSPEINAIKFSKRYDEKQQISTVEAKTNSCQNRSQERTTKEHHTSNGTSSNYHQNSREKQSKRKIIDSQSSPEINAIKFSKRYDEKQQTNTDEAKSNLCQDSVRKKFSVLPNNLEKRVSRIQNFKPSSQLKKQSDNAKEKSHQNKEKKDLDEEYKSPKNCKSNGANCLSVETSPAMKIEKTQMSFDDHGKDTIKNVPTIVRSSKKPEFASTTLSDDDYASRTPTKPAETLSKNRSSEVIELMEWVLKPITFHSDYKTLKKQSNVTNQRSNKQLQSSSSSSKSNAKDKPQKTGSSDSESPNRMRTNKTDSFISYTCPSQVKTVNSSAPSPNKVIRGRRPLNFGVSVVTH